MERWPPEEDEATAAATVKRLSQLSLREDSTGSNSSSGDERAGRSRGSSAGPTTAVLPAGPHFSAVATSLSSSPVPPSVLGEQPPSPRKPTGSKAGLRISLDEVQKMRRSTMPISYEVTASGHFRDGDLVLGAQEGMRLSQSVDSLGVGGPVHHPLLGAGMKLEDFKMMSVLGSGSTSVVKRALHVPSQTEVAIKIMQVEADPAARKQLLLELKTLQRTECPQVVQFFDAFYRDGQVFLVQEYMACGCIADLLTRGGEAAGIPESVLAGVAHSVLLGLNYLHRQLRLIHRDVKPANLLIAADGQVKIGDFGASGQVSRTMSKLATWVGTVTYMSPERVTGSQYSYNSDIWSCGLTLLECAVGRYPYFVGGAGERPMSPPVGGAGGAAGVSPSSPPPQPRSADGAQSPQGPNFWDLLTMVVNQPPPAPPAEKFSPAFCNFIQRCLQKEPETRPSANALLQHMWLSTRSATWTDWMRVQSQIFGAKHAPSPGGNGGGNGLARLS